MKILFCVEFYYPSVGGAQEVVRQIAERMAERGHDVTVATTQLATRSENTYNGVKIEGFAVSGNSVRGMVGEVERYQSYLAESDFDVVFMYAAQQWTFDASWGLLSALKAQKVFVPCGYSGLMSEAYARYFEQLPDVLRQFDSVIYHATDYRDYAFGLKHKLSNSAVIPNGADEREFRVPKDAGFRQRMGIAADEFVILTVGSLTGTKGHLELAQAFEHASLTGRKSVLILNGNETGGNASPMSMLGLLRSVWGYAKAHGVKLAVSVLAARALSRFGIRTGWRAKLDSVVKRVNVGSSEKRIVMCDMPRQKLIQAYKHADLFAFCSCIEYSPLVLFEACASGLPFLSVAVGNAAEIAAWTGGGEICPVTLDSGGFACIDVEAFARQLDALVANPDLLRQLGEAGQRSWEARFNWNSLCDEYEGLFQKLVDVGAGC